MGTDPAGQAQNDNSAVFSSVEQLEEAAQALGWNIEYRQLSKGDFSAEFASMQCEGIDLSSERFNNHLDIPSEPPEGFVGIFLPHPTVGRAEALGQALTKGDLVVFPPRSELEIVTRGVMRNETVWLSETEFLAAARALTPANRVHSSGSARIVRGNPRRVAAIRHEIDSIRQTGRLDAETAWNVLASTILSMEEASSQSRAERLTNGTAAAVARRARTFIEENYHDTIRMQELCTYCGVGVRTLQRCFASHFQVTPSEFIKARRLNAARRNLVSAEPSSSSVTAIAIENGFGHLGRFSVVYRRHFGESPRETLARVTRASSP